jgi:restriction system protein
MPTNTDPVPIRELLQQLIAPLRELAPPGPEWPPDPESMPLDTGTIADGPFGFTITYRTGAIDGRPMIEWLEQGRMATTCIRRRILGQDIEEVGYEQTAYSVDGSPEDIEARRIALHEHNKRFWAMVEERGLDTDITMATAINRLLLTEDVPLEGDEYGERQPPDLPVRTPHMSTSYMVRLGTQGMHLPMCLEEGVIGVDFDIHEDLTGRFPDEWREFNAAFIPKWLEASPGKTKIAAGLSCGQLWTLGRGISDGDIIITPDGAGHYRAARVTGPYQYCEGGPLPHRRPVEWLTTGFDRGQMSESLRASTGAPLTIVQLDSADTEVRELAGLGGGTAAVAAEDPAVENATVFAMEKYLEEFLVDNWAHTALGAGYDIYGSEQPGKPAGRQFPTDTGPMDILAVKKDGSELLVVELKRGRASDAVVGQVQRYMGFAASELAEPHQHVRGVIIALEDDLRIRRALAVASSIDFYRYEVTFTLHKA